MSEIIDFFETSIGSCKLCNLRFFANKLVCMDLTALYEPDFAKNRYTCTLYDDACLKKLISLKTLLVFANLCNL